VILLCLGLRHHENQISQRYSIRINRRENAARDAEEQEWAQGAFDRAILQLRQQRNQKLDNSDWRALSDQSLSQEWADYRQALRDLTQGLETVEDVGAVVWPTEPSE
jgi:hypothetical protein